MSKILGLDLGTNSIGWAITEKTESGYKLLDRGVDIFQEGVNRTQAGEEPSVKRRTEARAARRHYFRRRLRKIDLLKLLSANGMCPALTDEELDGWRHEKRYPLNEAFLAWQRTDDATDKNPYHDRYTALTARLDMSKQADRYTLGRALYHLVQRRGFLSNRKDQSDKESGEVKSAIKGLTADMEARGCRYLGEYFYQLYQSGEKIRCKHTSRKEHFEKEFYAICEMQGLSQELTRQLHKAIFYQRPLKSQKGSVGMCTFEKGKPRCPISHPRYEEFRMLSFLNNVKIQTMLDSEPRMLYADERRAAEKLFMRKSNKSTFDFEDIAKKLSGGKKGAYSCISDRIASPYKFNFKAETSVSGAPVTAALRSIFGEDWESAMCSMYTKGEGKSAEQIVNDVWHALFSFDDDDKLKAWAVQNLQLTDTQAADFAAIPVKQGYASLSLNAINKMLPYLRAGFRYDEAVFMANLSAVVPSELWNDNDTRTRIESSVRSILDDFALNPVNRGLTKEQCIADMLLNDFGIPTARSAKLYHPSKVEAYKDAEPDEHGVLRLGSPRTSSVRNPMAMRALFRLRALINALLRDGRIDKYTKVNIEFARGLNDANMRAAIEQFNREQERKHKEYADKIREALLAETGHDIVPTENDILKYQLWEEQNHICPYTGETISITAFIGDNPSYDIEHTVPRSRGGDNSQMNKTLCKCHFNRFIKRGRLPSELAEHNQIMARIEQFGWEKEMETCNLKMERAAKASKAAETKQGKDRAITDRHLARMKRDYWAGKLERFKMTEVPEGFSKRQGVDIGIIGRYARMYLSTVFERVYTVKGATTDGFRKMWGLQEEYSAKERINHVHHCIDAVTIACIDHDAYVKWAHYQSDSERYDLHRDRRPSIEKPWPTFTEDVKAIADTLLVSHHTADNMPKRGKKRLRIRGKIQRNDDGKIKYMQGDTARGALHQETFYGAIKRNDEIKYVVRKPLDALQQSDVDKIVDDAVRECVKAAIERDGFKNAMSKPEGICFNEEKGVYIKRVRIFTPSVTQPIKLKKHRDLSRFEYKQSYHVANDGNYCMAIYEGTDAKGKTKRSFMIKNNMDSARFFNGKTGEDYLVPQSDENDYPLKCILRTGTMVLFYENSPEELYECSTKDLSERLYKVVGLSSMLIQQKYYYGVIILRHHQEARQWKDIPIKKGLWKKGEEYRPVIGLQHTQLNAYVEGYDFELTVTGELKFKH